MRMSLTFCLTALVAVSCGAGKTPANHTLNDPSDLKLTAVSPTQVRLDWKDNTEEESAYFVFVRTPEDPLYPEPVAQLLADATTYTFTGLQEDTDYYFGVQASQHGLKMSQLVYAPLFHTDALEPEPEPDPNPLDPLTFSWTEVQGLGLPAGVKVYKTEDPLNGRPFHAWYAIADCSKDAQLRVLYPGNGVTNTIDYQASSAGNCLVLVNGGIFSGNYRLPIGFAISDGVQTPWRVADDGLRIDREYWSADGKLHPVSRAMVGVDRNGRPGVYWSFTPEYGTVFVYDQPIPSVAGGSIQEPGSATFPCEAATWVPWNALTCGPVLLKDGRCPINKKKTSRGYWETNYELWADDIFGVELLADRTAVGYTQDGKVILCICDGRITESQGATTLEMAAVMKGLGCVGAINLDGGGSTGMWAGGIHLNDLSGGNRPVMTTIGFFQR